MTSDNEALSLDDAATALVTLENEDSQDEQPEETLETDVNEPDLDEDHEEVETDEDELEDEDEGEDEELETEKEDDEQDDSETQALTDYEKPVLLPDGTTATVQDLLNGQMAHSEFTRKSQEIAEERKQYQEKQQTLEVQTNTLSVVLNKLLPPEPPLTMLDINSENYDPAKYQLVNAQRKELFDLLNETDGMIREKQTEQESTAQQQVQEAHQAALNELARQKPELVQPQKWEEYKTQMVETVGDYGIPAELLSSIQHPGVFQIIEDAAAFKKAKSVKPSKKKGKRPPVVRSAKQVSNKNNSAKVKRTAMNRLNQTGHLNDGVAALMALEKE
jgi:hypothetical protein